MMIEDIKDTTRHASSPLSSTQIRLSGAMRAGTLSALEECSDAMTLYRHALDKCSPAASMRYHLIQPHALLARVNMDIHVPEVKSTRQKDVKQSAFEMATKELLIEKLREDSQWLEDLVNATKQSLSLEGSLSLLLDEVTSKLATRAREDEILTRAQEIQEKMHLMHRNVTEERVKRIEEEKLLNTELLRLLNEKERLEVLFKAELEYMGVWLDSRQEEQKLEAEITRRGLTNGLNQCKMHEKNELLVTRQLQDFLWQNIKENEIATENWKKRRLTESKNYKREIHKVRQEMEKKRNDLFELRKEYDSRQEFIDNCLAEREAERRRLELEEYRNGRAVKIQAWWRGVMVRRKLGPYRPEQKKRKRPTKMKK